MNETEQKILRIEDFDWMQIENTISDLFNYELLSGKYLYNNDTVIFTENGEIKNLKDYSKYKINIFFGTCNYINNDDYVNLYSKNSIDSWKWKYVGNLLILNKIKPVNNLYENGYYLTNEIIKLKKIE
jgi:hypothetical protein